MSNQFGHAKIPALDNLIFYYDAGNTISSYKGQPTTNYVNLSSTPSSYNNPGLLTSVTNTGETFKECPVWRVDFTPQSDAKTGSMISAGDGIGLYHAMGINLETASYYEASIYIKSSPQYNLSYFMNTFSNINGWGYNSTTTTMYNEGDWIRRYTQNYESTNGYRTRATYTVNTFIVNTTSTTTITVSSSIIFANIYQSQGLYAIYLHSPSISNNGGLSALTVLNHGLETGSWTKASYPDNLISSSMFPYIYYIQLSVPNTSGADVSISIRNQPVGLYNYLTDSKFWKIAFKPEYVRSGSTLSTYWAAPMVEKKTQIMPSLFVSGTRSVSQSLFDLSRNKTTISLISASFDNSSSFYFSSSYVDIPLSNPQVYTVSAWIYLKEVGREQHVAAFNGTQFYIGSHNKLSGASWSTVIGNTALSINRWYNITMTRSAASCSVYLNGNFDGSGSLGSNGGNTLCLGDYSTHTGNYKFYGYIPIVQVYNKELESTEILLNYRAQRTRFL